MDWSKGFWELAVSRRQPEMTKFGKWVSNFYWWNIIKILYLYFIFIFIIFQWVKERFNLHYFSLFEDKWRSATWFTTHWNLHIFVTFAKFTAWVNAGRKVHICLFPIWNAWFQSESTLYSCLNVKELLARNRREIWSLSDYNGTWTHNYLIHKQTLNGWMFIYKLSGCGFESCCSHLNLKSVLIKLLDIRNQSMRENLILHLAALLWRVDHNILPWRVTFIANMPGNQSCVHTTAEKYFLFDNVSF